LAHLSRERWPPNLDRSFPLCRHATMRWLCSERILISPDTTSHLGRERGVCEPELARGARSFQPVRSPSMPGFRAEVLGFAFPRQPSRRRHAAREIVSHRRTFFSSRASHQPQRGSNSSLVNPLMCTAGRRIPASPGTNQGVEGIAKIGLLPLRQSQESAPAGCLLTHTIPDLVSRPILTPDLD